MTFKKILIANRGEIAVRIARGLAELDISSVAIFSEDDAESLHTRKADEARPLTGQGARAYLDIDQIVAVARDAGCDAVHPGYGFLSENAGFARACEEAGISFIGPTPDQLDLFGDKVKARGLARDVGVALFAGTDGPTTLEGARAFFESLGDGGAIMLKAVAGGGGRGMRAVTSLDEIEKAFTRCQSEAKAAFGNPEVYAEQFIPRARHIEVQVIGDGTGAVSHLWERECSIQRRNQKVIEIAPSPTISPALRERLTTAAVTMAEAANYRGLGTIEFLVDADHEGEAGGYAFMEANPRLQVEHTVTEEVTGVDLLKAQVQVASGKTLKDLGLEQDSIPDTRGFAIQARINMETMGPDGNARPSGGTISAFDMPSGPGIRVDTFGYSGYTTSPRYDSLLAKLIAYSASPSYADAVRKAYRALCECRIEGLATNIPLLQGITRHEDFTANRIYTRFVEEHIKELIDPDLEHHRYYVQPAVEEPEPAAAEPPAPASEASGAQSRRLAGARVDARDPLAVLSYGKAGSGSGEGETSAPAAPTPTVTPGAGPAGTSGINAPVQGTIVSVDVAKGDLVREGQQIAVMEAMKMEHVVRATISGEVKQLEVAPSDTVFEGSPLLYIEPREVAAGDVAQEKEVDLDHVRPDLAEVLERHRMALDEARPDAVERRRKTNQRTARENVNDLVDDGTFVEHGALVLTPGTGLPLDDVIKKFPTDGMITGVGNVNSDLFGADSSRAVVLSYDYTVLAGTQGPVNHPKTDRMLELAEKWRLPVLFFTEGGGGRAGTGGKRPGGAAAGESSDAVATHRPLDTPTFASMGRLSGLVPIVGINSGRCFAGNAALLGCCDVIIATRNSNIGMGGPAMIEGGGLGVFAPEEVGPMEHQVPNGVVDVAVEDEAEAVSVAKKYLSYFQGPVDNWEAADQRRLRSLVPENRLRVYDVRRVIETLADTDSVLELRPHFGLGMVTSFIRIEGRPVGVVANNPNHLAGAIDSDGSDKAARFMQLCDAFDIPILVLCDTPGMMVGPEVEKTALVRHCSRLFVTGANLSVPHMTIVLRKAYGLGAQAMAGGSFKEPFFAVAWPTGEFGGMGLEGQVKLGFRNELASIEDAETRVKRYDELVARAYERSKALNQGVAFGVDDVIDPADSRHWIGNALRSVPATAPRAGKKRANVDTW